MSIRLDRLRLVLALCLLALGATAARAAFPVGDSERDLPFGGLPRRYLVHVPPGYDGSTPVPLVVDIHGFGSNANQQRGISGMRALSDARGFLVVYPDGWENAWNANICCGNADLDDVGFIRAVVAAVAAEANIDPRRVYVAGLSNGGAMSHRLACDAADLFAAAAPMAFPLAYQPATGCQPSRSIPVLTVMGLTDMLVQQRRQAEVGGERHQHGPARQDPDLVEGAERRHLVGAEAEDERQGGGHHAEAGADQGAAHGAGIVPVAQPFLAHPGEEMRGVVDRDAERDGEDDRGAGPEREAGESHQAQGGEEWDQVRRDTERGELPGAQEQADEQEDEREGAERHHDLVACQRLVAGRSIHKSYDYGPGFQREFRLPSGRRVDAVNPAEILSNGVDRRV